MPTITIELDDVDRENLQNWIEDMGSRCAHAELAPILVEGLEPLAASERAYLAPHSKSGALAASLVARSGRGDRPGTVSAFSAPTAKVKDLATAWSRGRRQQRRWAAGLSGKGRRKVFYGGIVHQGHAIVKRNAQGQLRIVGRAEPVPFAQQAVDALGEAAAEATAEAVLEHIVGE